MALNFQPPSFVKPREYPDFGNTLDSVINKALQFKQMEQQQAQLDSMRNQESARMGQASLEFGFNPAVLGQRPGLLDMARQEPSSVEDPLVPRIREFLNRKEAMRKLGVQEKEAGLAKELAQTEKFKAEAASVGTEKASKMENTLRDELNKLSAPFQQVRDSFGRIQASAKNPTAAGDLALIFNYMKVLDPGSTVREGEFATAQNSAGVPDRIVAQYNRVLRGERMAPEQRQDFVSRAGELYQSQLAIQKQQEEQYRSIAKRSGANPENVIFNRALPEDQPEPQIRTLKDGRQVRVIPAPGGGWQEVP